MRFVYKVGIVTVLSSFLLMSHNASALTTTFSLDDYEPVNRIVYHLVDCRFYLSSWTSVTGVSQCSSNTSSVTPVKMMEIKSNMSYTLKKGDIITFDVVNYTPNGTAIEDFDWMAFKGVSNDMYLMDYESVFQEYHNHVNYDFSQDANTYFYTLNSAMRFTFFVTKDMSSQVGLSNTDVNYNPIASYTQISNNALKWNIINLVIYRKSGKSTINQEQEEATQNAADESETTAEDNSSSTQTTNLIGAFQSFVTALTSLSSTNCNVTLAFPSALGGNMQVNICQNKDYAGNIISVFGSLTLIVFYIPFSLKILSMIYNEIRSFTNG